MKYFSVFFALLSLRGVVRRSNPGIIALFLLSSSGAFCAAPVAPTAKKTPTTAASKKSSALVKATRTTVAANKAAADKVRADAQKRKDAQKTQLQTQLDTLTKKILATTYTSQASGLNALKQWDGLAKKLKAAGGTPPGRPTVKVKVVITQSPETVATGILAKIKPIDDRLSANEYTQADADALLKKRAAYEDQLKRINKPVPPAPKPKIISQDALIAKILANIKALDTQITGGHLTQAQGDAALKRRNDLAKTLQTRYKKDAPTTPVLVVASASAQDFGAASTQSRQNAPGAAADTQATPMSPPTAPVTPAPQAMASTGAGFAQPLLMSTITPFSQPGSAAGMIMSGAHPMGIAQAAATNTTMGMAPQMQSGLNGMVVSPTPQMDPAQMTPLMYDSSMNPQALMPPAAQSDPTQGLYFSEQIPTTNPTQTPDTFPMSTDASGLTPDDSFDGSADDGFEDGRDALAEGEMTDDGTDNGSSDDTINDSMAPDSPDFIQPTQTN